MPRLVALLPFSSIHLLYYQESGPLMVFEEARSICRNHTKRYSKFSTVELVYGYTGMYHLNTIRMTYHGVVYVSGDGKTFYIKEQLKKAPESLTIAINEAFSVANAVRRLQSLSTNVKGCALYFNFTLLPPGVCMFAILYLCSCVIFMTCFESAV